MEKLTHAQKRIWYSSMHERGSYYNLVGYIKYDSPLNKEKVEETIGKMYELYDSLHTSIGGVIEPYMVVGNKPYEIEGIYISNQDLLESELMAYNTHVYELNDHFLVDIKPVYIEGDIRAIYIRGHHIVLDATSYSLLVGAFESIYFDGVIPDVTPYDTFKRQEEAYKQSQQYLIDQSYFKKHINAFSQEEDLIKADEMAIYETDRALFTIQPNIADGIRSYLSSNKTSLFRFFTSILALYFHKMTKEGRIAILAGHHNRLDETKNLVGMTVSSVPLLFQIKEGQSFDAFRRSAHKMIKESLSHQAYGFDEMLPFFKDANIASNHLFCASVNQIPEASDLKGNLVRMCPMMDTIPFNFKINPNQKSLEDLIEISIDYNTDQYDKTSISQLFKRLEHIIKQVLINSETPIESISLVPNEELKKLMHLSTPDISQTRTVYKSVMYQFYNTVSRMPDKVAIIDRESKITYKALQGQIEAYISEYNQIQPGDVVAVKIRRSSKIIPICLSIMSKRAIYMPLEGTLSDNVTQTYIESAKAKWLIDDLGIHKTGQEKTYSDDGCYVIMTSGSTGAPKPILIGRPAYNHFCSHYLRAFNITKETIASSYASYGFDLSLSEYIPPLLTGATVVMLREEEQQNLPMFIQTIKKNHVNTVTLPTALSRLVMNASLPNCVSKVIVAGEALGVCSKKPYEVFNAYGPAEATILSTYYVLNGPTLDAPIGRGLGDTCTYVLDESMNLCPYGSVGELYLSGSQIGIKYLEGDNSHFIDEAIIRLGNSELTVSKLYKTGDLVKWNKDQLVFIGRNDRQIKHNGKRIDLLAIESALNRIKPIKECAVVYRNNKIEAFYSGQDQMELEGIKVCLRTILPEYMTPHIIERLEEIPKTMSGKIDYEACMIRDIKGQITYDADSMTDQGIEMANLWQTIIGVRPVDMDDQFMSIGGDSLSLMNLLVEIESRYKVAIPYSQAYKDSSISNLLKIIALNKPNQLVVVKEFAFHKMNTAPDTKRIYCFYDFSGESYAYGNLATFYEDKIQVYGSRINPYESELAQVVKSFVEEINSYSGPIVLMGYSFGAVMAYHVYRALGKVKNIKLCLMDCPYNERTSMSSIASFTVRNSVNWLAEMPSDYKKTFIKRQLSTMKNKKNLSDVIKPQMLMHKWLNEPKNTEKQGRVFIFVSKQRRKKKDVTKWKHLFTKAHLFLLPGSHVEQLSEENIRHIDKVLFGGKYDRPR